MRHGNKQGSHDDDDDNDDDDDDDDGDDENDNGDDDDDNDDSQVTWVLGDLTLSPGDSLEDTWEAAEIQVEYTVLNCNVLYSTFSASSGKALDCKRVSFLLLFFGRGVCWLGY